ncbi:response regulator [Brevundimonas mediterranea]|uniref:Regulatory protein VirG n=1 Tax=Brevundimonas mediterranea TaxID=74329 RepID=A0A7W6F174_9CAUL|nr:response regulator transcription factor [Brevundimonas mediterranea]MBB3873700.1 two-component system OmpR family response regulator [Brevundimonas mediterranea]
MTTVLIHLVEDDPEIRDLVCALLAREGLECAAFPDAAAFWAAWTVRRPDLVILDLMMPGEDGLSVCRRIQGAVPVLIASARGEPLDRVVGLEVGADDYIAKPFEPRELVARVKALLRRRDRAEPRPPARHLAFDGWRLDLASRALTDAEGRAVELTGGEFDLLAAFVKRPQQVLSRDDIMDVLKGRQADVFDRSIDIQVSRLRRKLGDHPREPRLIRTVRNAGYLFTADVEVQS